MIPTELGTERIGKLLKQYALPAIIAMTASSIYNMVDSIFIGQGVGPMAISGLAVTFPLMNLGTAFGTLVGVGASTLISMLLGQKNYDMANKVFGNAVILNIIISIAFAAIALVFRDPILYFFGASSETIPYAREYIEAILYGNVISHMYFGLNGIVRASGHPRDAMKATIVTVILNTILDPIFIFVLNLGIRGAAIATVISQFVSLCWVLSLFCNKKEVIHFSRGIMHFDRKIANRSLSIGLSPFLMNVAACFVVLLINNQLKRHGGDLAIGAYGIVNRIVFIFVMINMGINQGLQPIAGYNFGAMQYDRVKEVLGMTIKWATMVTTAAFIVGMVCPRAAVSIFTSDEALRDLAARAFRITVCVFPIVGYQIVVSNFFQSIGYAKKAIFLSLSRQLLFLLPFLIILPSFLGTDGVWWSMPASDLIAALVAFVMISKLMKTFGSEKTENKIIK